MKEICRRLIGFWVVAAALTTCIAFNTIAQGETPADALLFVGTPGPNAIPLHISTGKDRSDTFRLGETIWLNFRASRQCYVMAVILSAAGDASIILPSGEAPDNRILPDKEYTLFGPGSRVQLVASERLKDSKIILYVSSKQFNLAALKASAEKQVVSVPHSKVEEMQVLRGKIEDVSRDKGFNREILFVKPAGDSAVSLVRIGLPETIKGMEPPKSVKPGGLTGGQGAKTGVEKPDQR